MVRSHSQRYKLKLFHFYSRLKIFTENPIENIPVERAMESEDNHTKNTMLGHWIGRMAFVTAAAPIEMVSNGQRYTIVQ